MSKQVKQGESFIYLGKYRAEGSFSSDFFRALPFLPVFIRRSQFFFFISLTVRILEIQLNFVQSFY